VLKQRIITAIFLLSGLALVTTLLPPFFFAVLISLLLLLAVHEWSNLVGIKTNSSRVAYMASMAVLIISAFWLLGISPAAQTMAVDRVITLMILGLVFWCAVFYLLWGYPQNRPAWNAESKIALMGIFALIPVWAGIIQLKYFHDSGVLVLALILLVSSVDIGAYFTGVSWGRHKLAPNLSPNKTWEGFWGGVAACVVMACLLIGITILNDINLGLVQIIGLMFAATFVAFFSVAGDLFESMLKRNRNLKDSGKLLPGHGGLMDRIDSLIAATPIFVLILTLMFADSLWQRP